MYEQIERLQVRKDQLLRDNEKLRAENKGSRKYLFNNASNAPSGGIVGQQQQLSSANNTSTSATRYMVGKSMTGTL